MLAFLVLAQATYYGSGKPPPAPPPSHEKGIFSYEDYPLEAVRHHWEGVVRVELTINEQGAIEACRIVQSSGHEVLDAATCNLLIKRARFTPARDENGNPTKGTVLAPPVTWRLP